MVGIGLFIAILGASRGQAEISYISSHCVGGVSGAQEAECALHVEAQHAANVLLAIGGAIAAGGVVVFLVGGLISRRKGKLQAPKP